MVEISQMLGTQSSILLSQQNNNGNGNSNSYSIFISLLFSSLLVSIITQFTNKFYLPDIFGYKFLDIFEDYGCKKRKYTIKLSSRRFFNKFGRHSNDITEEKLSVLYKIQKIMDNCNDLFRLELDYKSDYAMYDEEYITNSYYTLDQSKSIEIYREGEHTIRAVSIDDSVKESEEGKSKTSDIKMTKINELILTSYKSLDFIKRFIDDCVEERKNDLKAEKKRYIFTYLGEDDQKKLTYDQDLFIPYANFKGLVGENSKKVERDFDFFHSKEGKQWYKDRNLPYQITHLYHGIPGSGKSIVASAIAKKYNLHIIRIKLSLIKSSREFIKVFKNTKINNIHLEFKDVLYLFDEMDTELEKIVNNGNKTSIEYVEKYLKRLKKNKKKNEDNNAEMSDDSDSNDTVCPNFSVINNSTTSDLTVGTILEEMSGINQMFGRKMIIITNNFNKLKNIHKGALVRPGRVDRILHFKKCSPDECKELIKNFFHNCKFTNEQTELLENNIYTAAKISSICKISRNIDECVNKLINNI